MKTMKKEGGKSKSGHKGEDNNRLTTTQKKKQQEPRSDIKNDKYSIKQNSYLNNGLDFPSFVAMSDIRNPSPQHTGKISKTLVSRINAVDKT